MALYACSRIGAMSGNASIQCFHHILFFAQHFNFSNRELRVQVADVNRAPVHFLCILDTLTPLFWVSNIEIEENGGNSTVLRGAVSVNCLAFLIEVKVQNCPGPCNWPQANLCL